MPPSRRQRRRAGRRWSSSCARFSARRTGPPIVRMTVQTTDGRTLDGAGARRGLRRPAAAHRRQAASTCCAAPAIGFRAVTSETAVADLQRRSRRQPLHDADADRQERPSAGSRRRGCSRCPTPARCRCTPVVVDGIMYVTAPNECYALDAGSGRQIWHYKRPRTQGRLRRRRQSRRRGRRRSRVHGDRPRAHHRARTASPASCCGTPSSPTGARTTRRRPRRCRPATWSSPASPAASTAPTASSPRTIRRPARKSGASGPCRSRGEPGSETWQGKDIEHGGAPTWFTGSYDSGARSRLLADRQSEQGVQRRRSQGRQPLRELHPRARSQDRRAEVALSVHAARSVGLGRDADVGAGRRRRGRAQPRKLMLHATRNGFFYVFDRARRQAAAVRSRS